jgi:acyl carrier protein
LDHDLNVILRRFIADNFLFSDNLDGLTETTSFRESGLIDSTGVIELVQFLEQTFGITIHDEDMVPENLDCIAAVAAFVHRKTLMGRLAA